MKELTDESLARLAAKGAGSGEARELLYRRFLPLLAGTARRFGCPRETEDLIQEGYFGLVAAAERYREETGVPFRFYALLWIRRSMGRYLEQCSGLIRIPAAKRALMRKYRRLAESWEIGHGQKLPDCRAALLLGIPEKGLAALKRNMAMEEPESLEALLEQEAPRGPEPAREGPEDEILDKITGAALKEALLACLEGLPEEAAAAVRFRYLEEREGSSKLSPEERRLLGLRVRKGLSELRKRERPPACVPFWRPTEWAFQGPAERPSEEAGPASESRCSRTGKECYRRRRR